MPGQVRTVFPGAVDQATVRADRARLIAEDDTERNQVVRRSEELAEKTNRKVFTWKLMKNHSHLLFKPPV